MGFDFIVIAPLLLSHCGLSFVFACGVYFLVSSSVFLSMIVQQLVLILVFAQEGVKARPTLPSRFRLPSLPSLLTYCSSLWDTFPPLRDYLLKVVINFKTED